LVVHFNTKSLSTADQSLFAQSWSNTLRQMVTRFYSFPSKIIKPSQIHMDSSVVAEGATNAYAPHNDVGDYREEQHMYMQTVSVPIVWRL